MPNWFDILTKLALPAFTLCVAVCGAVYTALQFQRAKRARAVDLAISLTGQLDIVPELAFACQALDWGFGPLIVPERYRALLEKRGADGAGPATPEDRGEVIEHNVALLVKALRPYISFDVRAEPVCLIYRYCFDKLFQHLDNVERLVVSGQLAVESIRKCGEARGRQSAGGRLAVGSSRVPRHIRVWAPHRS